MYLYEHTVQVIIRNLLNEADFGDVMIADEPLFLQSLSHCRHQNSKGRNERVRSSSTYAQVPRRDSFIQVKNKLAGPDLSFQWCK